MHAIAPGSSRRLLDLLPQKNVSWQEMEICWIFPQQQQKNTSCKMYCLLNWPFKFSSHWLQ